MFDDTDAIVRAALGKRFTAAVVRVEQGGRVRFERAYGGVDDTPEAMPVFVTTRFDLASLTKPFVATAVLNLVARGVMDLDSPLAETLLPEWVGTDRAAITVRHLLAHDSGMQSGADYRQLFGENVERYALERPLAGATGGPVIYSDLGFIALGLAAARAARTSLAALLHRTCRGLGCEATAYGVRPRERAAVPATEDDGWRGRVRGIVHDEKAYLMGGIAGHAGLFGTARDVAKLAEAYLAALAARTTPLDSALAREAVREQAADPVLRRGLGWALKTRDDNSCGALMSRETFGHTGFVGTVAWADPQRDLSIVFLTNAVYFGRTDLREVRAAVCDAVTAEVDG